MFLRFALGWLFFISALLLFADSVACQEPGGYSSGRANQQFVVVQVEKLDGKIFQIAVKEGELAIYRNDTEGVFWGLSASSINARAMEADIRVFELTGNLTDPQRGSEIATLSGGVGFKAYIQHGSAPSLTTTQITSDPFQVLAKTNASCRPMPQGDSLNSPTCCVVCNGDMVCACAVGGGCGSCCGSCC